jgi:hypothetical protein
MVNECLEKEKIDEPVHLAHFYELQPQWALRINGGVD